MNFYKKIFAQNYDSFVQRLERDLFKAREDLLANLKGQILDVGAGTGVNFQHFGKGVKIFAVEPSTFMIEKAKKKLHGRNDIVFLNHGINDELLQSKISNESFDYIVCTLVLCTIPDLSMALKKFEKWLKPTGKLIVLEHIHSAKRINKTLQNIINPIWRKIGDGCNLNRDTDRIIKASNFELENEEYFIRTLRFYKAVYRIGSTKI